MQKFSKIVDIMLYIIVGIVLTAAITSAILDRPMFFSSVRSNSMYPLFERSDMLLIKNLSPEDNISLGDIVLFSAEEGSLASQGWIVHRVVGGNNKEGYITKGDANNYTDQESGGAVPIQREWIVSKVRTIGQTPLKVPLIGYISLWMENFQSNTFAMPIIAVVLAGVLGVSELLGNNKPKKKKAGNLELPLLYFLAGFTITIVMCASMLATSQKVIIPYEISAHNRGVVMGSNVGIMQIGDIIERPLSELSNKGFFPLTATVTTDDDQIILSRSLITLKANSEVNVDFKVEATNPGAYTSTVHIGMYYPLLPKSIIYKLAETSFWLAVIVVSLIPGLPLMLFPIIDGKLRRKTIKEIRRVKRRISKFITI